MERAIRRASRSVFDALLAMTRMLPAVGFGRTGEPPTSPISREEHLGPAAGAGELHEQQHVGVPSRAVGKPPKH